MTTTRAPESLQLTAPGVGEDYVRAEFARLVGVDIQQATDYLSGESDGFPAGFTQSRNAFASYAEHERDFYIEQFSEAFGAGTYGFDTAMTKHERDTTETPGVLVQRPNAGPDTITLKLGKRVKDSLGIPSEEEVTIEGCTYRRVIFGGDRERVSGRRLLILNEYEIPRVDTTTGDHTMARVLLFAPARAQ